MSAVMGDGGGGGADTGGSLESSGLGGDIGVAVGGAGVEQAPEQEQIQQQPDAGVEQPEVDISQLDLAQPDQLQHFRSSYEKVKFERDQALQDVQTARTELDTLRAGQDHGVYIRTDVPLEEFNPRDQMTRMCEEEPEYYEAIAADFMDTHFWPDLADQVRSIEGVVLNENDPNDSVKLEALTSAWDVMSRRMTQGQLDGEGLYNVLRVLHGSPDLQQVVLARINGQQAEIPQGDQGGYQGYGQQQTQQGYSANSPIQVQSAEVIANQYGLDPTDRGHALLIQQMQTEQQQRQNERIMHQREVAQQRLQSQQLEERLTRVSEQQQQMGKAGQEEAQKRAETRLADQLETSLTGDIQTRYGNAIPKDRPGLLGDIKTIAEQELKKNSDYTSATARAAKWFKQAAGASNPTDRDRWDKAGLDCLAVVGVHRANAIAQAAERLLGPVRRTVQRQNQRTAQLQQGRQEFRGGTATPPVQARPPAPTGDVQATRNNIKQRLADARNRGVPGLPRF